MLRALTAAAPLLLGSGSPRRREILASLRIPHVVRAADADETRAPGEPPVAYLERVALAKLDAVRARLAGSGRITGEADDGRVVLVADTAVIDGSEVLGKPTSADDGRWMISRLSARTHDVCTRFLLADARGGAPWHAETVTTRVTFREVAPEEARAYAADGEGRDKAGGYAAQGLAAAFVARIDGSYSSVVGLPACELVVALRRLGIW